MKNGMLLFCLMVILSCTKEPIKNPLKLKNGQIVELLVGDKYGAQYDPIIRLPSKNAVEASLHNFAERKPGFDYKVRAEFVINDPNLQDVPSYYFEFINVISATRHTAQENFIVPLTTSPLFGGTYIRMNKENDKYFLFNPDIELNYSNDAVKKQLEDVWQEALANRTSQSIPKWKEVTATVMHNPNNFGNAYLIEKIEFL